MPRTIAEMDFEFLEVVGVETRSGVETGGKGNEKFSIIVVALSVTLHGPYHACADSGPRTRYFVFEVVQSVRRFLGFPRASCEVPNGLPC